MSRYQSLLLIALMFAGIAPAESAYFKLGHSWSGTTPLFEPDQTTAFTISKTPAETFERVGARFDLFAKGDYSDNQATEFLEWSIDGIVSGVAGPAYGGSITNNTQDDVEWTQSFNISEQDLLAILADSSFTVILDNSRGVGCCFDVGDYNRWALTVVPLPAVSGLFASLFLLLVKARRRPSS